MTVLDLELQAIRIMAALRFFSSLVECLAAVLILRLHHIEDALRVNAVLGLVGPAILTLVTLVGLVAAAQHLSIERFALILVAVVLIFVATRA